MSLSMAMSAPAVSGVTALRSTGRVSRSAAAPRVVVVRAEGEEKAVTKATATKPPALYPAGADTATAEYLTGELPGDYGFDPLGMYDPEGQGGFISQDWLRYAEIIHGRYAMLGAAGCLAPEVMAKIQPGFPEATNVLWYKSGVIGPANTLDSDFYWTDPYTLFFVQIIAMQFAELRRLQDFKNPGSMGKQYFLGLESIFEGSGDPAYPGGPFFNMFNLGNTPEKMAVLKTKEIKNGRLAMLAMFGFGAQAIITQEGPFQNLLDHVSNPNGANMLTNFGSIYGGGM